MFQFTRCTDWINWLGMQFAKIGVGSWSADWQASGFVEAGLPGAVVAGCDCFWLFWLTSGPRRLRTRRGYACRRRSVAGWCPYQCTHSAVATSTASMSSQGLWLRINSALYKEFRASARAKPKGVALRPHRGDHLALRQDSPVANRPALTRRGGKW